MVFKKYNQWLMLESWFRSLPKQVWRIVPLKSLILWSQGPKIIKIELELSQEGFNAILWILTQEQGQHLRLANTIDPKLPWMQWFSHLEKGQNSTCSLVTLYECGSPFAIVTENIFILPEHDNRTINKKKNRELYQHKIKMS